MNTTIRFQLITFSKLDIFSGRQRAVDRPGLPDDPLLCGAGQLRQAPGGDVRQGRRRRRGQGGHLDGNHQVEGIQDRRLYQNSVNLRTDQEKTVLSATLSYESSLLLFFVAAYRSSVVRVISRRPCRPDQQVYVTGPFIGPATRPAYDCYLTLRRRPANKGFRLDALVKCVYSPLGSCSWVYVPWQPARSVIVK